MMVGAALRLAGRPCQSGRRALSRAAALRRPEGEGGDQGSSSSSSSSSFAESFKKFEDISQPKPDVARRSESFLTLLRNSPFIKVGCSVVIGLVLHFGSYSMIEFLFC